MHRFQGLSEVMVGVLAVAFALSGCSTTAPQMLVTPMESLPRGQAIVTAVAMEKVEGSVRAIVQATQALPYTAVAISDPPRLILDLPETTLGERLQNLIMDEGIVQRMEPLPLPDQKGARLIFYLRQAAPHTIEAQGEQLVIAWGSQTTAQRDSSTPGAPASAAETAPGVSIAVLPTAPQGGDLSQWTGTVVTGVTFENQGEQPVVLIRTVGAPPQVRIKQRQHPAHLTLDIQEARLAPQQERVEKIADPHGLITSVSTLPIHDAPHSTVQVVVDLQTPAPFEVQQNDGVVRLALRPTSPPLAVAPETLPRVAPVLASSIVPAAAVASLGSYTPPASATVPARQPAVIAQVARTGEPVPPITESTSSGTLEPRQYTGQRISLDFQNADVNDILRLIAEVSGLNIIASGDVQGTVTTRMVDVPWDQALDVVLKINGLDQERDGNIIRVAPLERFTKEREDRLKARTTVQQAEPLVTRVISINYTTAASLKSNLEKLLSGRGSLFIDERTNNMILTDTQDRIDDVLQLISTLDRPTPQVIIEARIVESTRNFMRELGVQIGLSHSQVTNQAFPSTIGIRGGGVPATPQPGSISSTPGNFLVDLPAAIGRGAGGALGLSFASIGGSLLDVQLSALEASGRGKVISSPRIATLDNTEAKILSGRRIPYATVSQEGTRTEFAEANLELKVTPHITPNDFIGLVIQATRNTADFANQSSGVPTIITREAITNMMVKDGDTVVIGGLYTRTLANSKDGVPFLSKIPVLGSLFQTTRESDDTEELLIFITPRILRQPIETPGKTRAVVN